MLTMLSFRNWFRSTFNLFSFFTMIMINKTVFFQVYFRSSDDSAAIASAYSNLIGIYYRRSHQSGKDYPSVTGWPQDFVPVPVHGAEPTTDYVSNFIIFTNYSLFFNILLIIIIRVIIIVFVEVLKFEECLSNILLKTL